MAGLDLRATVDQDRVADMAARMGRLPLGGTSRMLDATNEDALQEVDIVSFGPVIAGIDNDYEASAIPYFAPRTIAKRVCCLQVGDA